MFRDLNGYQPRKEPRPPERKYPQLTARQEKILVLVIFFNLAMALFAPFCGSTLIQGMLMAYRSL